MRDPGPPPAMNNPPPHSPPPLSNQGARDNQPPMSPPPPASTGTGGDRPAGARPVAMKSHRGVQIKPLSDKEARMLELQESILDRLVPRLDLDNIPIERLAEESLWQKAESAIVDLVETLDSSGELPPFINQDSLIKEALNEALGLGPLEDLLADDSVQEIVVDRRDRVLVSRDGQLTGSGRAFSSDETLRRVVERLVAPSGQFINEDTPLVDIRLRDGSRLAAAIPPVAVRGVCLTLRKPQVEMRYAMGDLIDGEAVSSGMAEFLNTCVGSRRNVLVCGAPGAGKSMVLAALADSIPAGERIVSVEEVAELELGRQEWIALEARPRTQDSPMGVGLDALLQSALRMRADRLIVGDVRGAEAMELVSALASSSDGSLVAGTGDSPLAGLARLATMARLAAPGAAADAIRELVACAVDVVVHVSRYADGKVRVSSIAEVGGTTGDGFMVRELFCYRDRRFMATGVVPSFYDELQKLGINADSSIFR